MTSSICDIPYEVINEYIVPNFLFKDVRNFNKINNFETHDMIDVILKKDPVLHKFAQNFEINIYDTVKNSSIRMSTFDEMISNFRNDKKIDNIINFNMDKLNKNKIKNTIIILKLFKTYSNTLNSTNSSNDSAIILSQNLVKYMSDSFVLLNKTFKEISCKEFNEVLEKIWWENISIDLYDFFEKCQFSTFKPRSYALKSNIEENLINNTLFQFENLTLLSSINLFMKLVVEFKEIRTKLYVIYELYRYLNYTEENNKSITCHSKDKLKIAAKIKAQEFMYQLQYEYTTELPKYLKILVEKELSEYIKR